MKALIPCLLLLAASPLSACPKCRPLVQAGIHNASFGLNIALMLLPLIVLLGIGALLYFADDILPRLRQKAAL